MLDGVRRKLLAIKLTSTSGFARAVNQIDIIVFVKTIIGESCHFGISDCLRGARGRNLRGRSLTGAEEIIAVIRIGVARMQETRAVVGPCNGTLRVEYQAVTTVEHAI